MEREERRAEERIESKRAFTLLDFVYVPFFICPVFSLLRVINKAVNALLPALRLLLTADFIDTALAVFGGMGSRKEILLPLGLLAGVIFYENLNWQFMSYVNLQSEMKITRYFSAALVKKRARLQYRLVEDEDTWELVRRT